MRVDNGRQKKTGYFNVGGMVDWPPSGPIPYEEILERQIFKESRGNPDAVSPAGARGLTQIMPGTEQYLKEKGLIPEDFNVFDPDQARMAQQQLMGNLMDRSWNKGSEEVRIAKALAAYNAGSGRVVGILNEEKAKGTDIYDSLDWLEAMPLETRDYVKKILGYNDKFETEWEDFLGVL